VSSSEYIASNYGIINEEEIGNEVICLEELKKLTKPRSRESDSWQRYEARELPFRPWSSVRVTAASWVEIHCDNHFKHKFLGVKGEGAAEGGKKKL
jgi:hypothetical protein